MTNIWIAAADNDMATIKQALENGTSPNAKDENGYTPLHAAASYGHIDLLKFLVEKGGDVNITDNDGDTPLHACEAPLAARTLVQLGADATLKNDEDQTPLDKAVEEQEFPELINYFMILSGKGEENMEFRATFQQHQDTDAPLPGERSLNPEQREELVKIIENGTDADLEAFLQTAMAQANAEGASGGESFDSPNSKRTKNI